MKASTDVGPSGPFPSRPSARTVTTVIGAVGRCGWTAADGTASPVDPVVTAWSQNGHD